MYFTPPFGCIARASSILCWRVTLYTYFTTAAILCWKVALYTYFTTGASGRDAFVHAWRGLDLRHLPYRDAAAAKLPVPARRCGCHRRQEGTEQISSLAPCESTGPWQVRAANSLTLCRTTCPGQVRAVNSLIPRGSTGPQVRPSNSLTLCGSTGQGQVKH